MSFKRRFVNKLLVFILLLTIIIPTNVLAYSSSVIVGGQNIGIEVKSKGVLIVGFYNVDGISPGQIANLKVGDLITKIDDTDIYRITDLSDVIKENIANIKITYIRDNSPYTTELVLIKDGNNTYKTGLYVKDSIVGIGTLTFIDPNTLKFGALGHEIAEKSTGKTFIINDGTIFKSVITGIDRSERNSPGEKNAKYYSDDIYGTIKSNTISGIFGNYIKSIDTTTLMTVANPNEIELGTAKIRTVINGSSVEEFEITITKTFTDSNTKNILFEITDKTLLSKTNGVVQGMSGSPIIQNEKIIGAVNYVLVDNPHKGYGIFITNMLEEADKTN